LNLSLLLYISIFPFFSPPMWSLPCRGGEAYARSFEHAN